DDAGACASGYSCLVNQCIKDGSLGPDATCNHEQQCGSGLTCVQFACHPGCAQLYSADDCQAGTWCKPAQVGGQCSPSECDPSTVTWCDTNVACAAFASGVGGCVPFCDYGFASATYRDNCVDTA